MGTSIRFLDIVWWLLGAILAALIALFLVSISRPSYGLLASGAAFSAWILLGYRGIVGDRGWKSLGSRFAPVSGGVLWASAAGGVCQILGFLLLVPILSALGAQIREPPPSPFGLDRFTVPELPFALLIIAILGPLAEELLFRGVLLDWLRQHASSWLAIVLVSAVFSLLHGNHFELGLIGWLQFANRFLLGIVTSILALRYHSLRPAFVFHGSCNAVVCVVSALR
jgi:membrane protease YdiL (CAAX protease family)